MKTMLMMAGMAFLLGSTTMVKAGEGGCCRSESVSEDVGGEGVNMDLRCNPSTGNWSNDARKTCPPTGSGAGKHTVTHEVTICRDRKD